MKLPAKTHNEGPLLGEDVEAEVEAAPLPSEENLANVIRIAQQQVQVEDEIAELEAKLKDKQLLLKGIREQQLPLALTELGLSGLPLTGGYAITMREVIGAYIAKERTPQAHEWLETNGHGDLIKHTFTVTFGKGEEAWAKKFYKDLQQRKKPLKVKRKDAVNTNTLGAFVRDQIRTARGQGISPETVIPYDLFGVFISKVTDVSRP